MQQFVDRFHCFISSCEVTSCSRYKYVATASQLNADVLLGVSVAGGSGVVPFYSGLKSRDLELKHRHHTSGLYIKVHQLKSQTQACGLQSSGCCVLLYKLNQINLQYIAELCVVVAERGVVCANVNIRAACEHCKDFKYSTQYVRYFRSLVAVLDSGDLYHAVGEQFHFIYFVRVHQ